MQYSFASFWLLIQSRKWNTDGGLHSSAILIGKVVHGNILDKYDFHELLTV